MPGSDAPVGQSGSTASLRAATRLRVRRCGPLRGEVRLSGAKNAALPLLVSTVVRAGRYALNNVPTRLIDVGILLEILREIGVGVAVDGSRVSLDTTGELRWSLPPGPGSRIRYSLLFLGALLARGGRAWVPYPGGCRIGDRQFDLHLLGLRRLGARITEEADGIRAEADRLVGADVEFRIATTSGTENVMLAAVLARGRTTIINAQTRPEIQDLANFLNRMGARVHVLNRIIEIEGVDELHPTDWTVLPGQDEAFTFMVACGVCGGEIFLPGLSPQVMEQEIEQVRKAGLEVFAWGGALYVAGRGGLRPVDIQTAPYPGINSDLQPLFAALALRAPGISTITDTRFPDRFAYAEEMRKLGAQIYACGNVAIVRGGHPLRGAEVVGHDIRTGAALVLAGLAAEGETVVTRADQVDRGYEAIEEKLNGLGAAVTREMPESTEAEARAVHRGEVEGENPR